MYYKLLVMEEQSSFGIQLVNSSTQRSTHAPYRTHPTMHSDTTNVVRPHF